MEKASFSVRDLCAAFAVSPSGFYAWQSCPISAHAQEDRRLRVFVRASLEVSRQWYGMPVSSLVRRHGVSRGLCGRASAAACQPQDALPEYG